MGLLDSTDQTEKLKPEAGSQNSETEMKDVEITPAAIDQIRELHQKENHPDDHGLRLGVKGGGCSGLSYELKFSGPQEKDKVIEKDGVKVYIDPKSFVYLKGIRLDYETGLKGKGFVFSNPNASNTCGCGESFSV